MANINELNQYGKNITGFKVGRSKFPLDNENVLTLKAGDIVPIWHTEVYPGDTFEVGFSFVERMLTPVNPTMDNAFQDFYAFYIPDRLITEKYHLTTTEEDYTEEPEEYGNWKTFFTENENGSWDEQETTYLKLYKPDDLVTPQSVLDYLGYPIGKVNENYYNYKGTKITQIEMPAIMERPEPIHGLEIAALDLIYNDWFRNENLEAPTIFRQNGEIGENTNKRMDTTKTGNTGKLNMAFGTTDGWQYTEEGNYDYTYPYKSTKFADAFTNALPEPYKLNTDIILTMATNGEAEVTLQGQPLVRTDKIEGFENEGDLNLYGIPEGDKVYLQAYGTNQKYKDSLYVDLNTAETKVDLTQATGVTINELREAITIQHIAEAFARGGTRYSEILHAIYGTAPDDITLERPELLGAKRFPINTTQVVNAAISASGDLGELGAYSHTTGTDQYIISKSFKEHGILMIVTTIRTSNKYYQGIDKQLTKHRLFDYYFPQFAGLGEQAILNKEIYMSGNSKTDNEVFGYQEAFYELHYKKDELHGYVNPCSGDKTLASYTYQVPFTKTPVLNNEFDKQSAENIGKTLYDTETNSQFLLDIYFNVTAVREMPVHSIPGVDRI